FALAAVFVASFLPIWAPEQSNDLPNPHYRRHLWAAVGDVTFHLELQARPGRGEESRLDSREYVRERGWYMVRTLAAVMLAGGMAGLLLHGLVYGRWMR